jgi:YD repeat-containing protein
MQPLCHQRTTGEETLACLHEIRVSGTRVHAPGRHDAAELRAAMLRRRVRSVKRCVVVACLAVIGTVHAASNVVQYTHDAAGNIVGIRRVNPSPITIAGFAPSSGPTGTVVTITGTGFGATPTTNAVTFNGVAGTVVTAAVTALTVAVPAGAATGRIAVTVAGNTATSAQDFVVAAPGVPTIAGFTPAAGPPGTAVSVVGTNFNATPGATTVKLNQNAATASSVTTTQLAFAVPAATGSGRIRIATTAGSVVSAADFVVPPGSIAAADIIATTRLAANGQEQGLGLFAAGKYGAVLFDGNAGDWLSLQFRNYAVNPAGAGIAYTIYKPDNTQLASGKLSPAGLSIHLPPLPVAGTYTLLLATGIAQVSFDARLESNVFVPDGTTLAVARSAGQSTRLLIAAVAGDQKALMVSGLTTVPAGGRLDYTIALPSGGTFRTGSASGLGSTTQLPPFTMTGTHSAVFTASTTTTQSAFKVGFLAGVVLPVDGGAIDLAIANPGEGARLNVAGVAGQNLGLGITGLVLSPTSATSASIAVYKPDAGLLASISCRVDGTQCAANLTNLPVTGTYSIIVQPASGATGTLQAWLSRDATETLSSGTPFRLTLARPGQNARLTFTGTASALIALQVRGVVTSPAAQGLFITISKPDGSWLTYSHLTGAGQILVAPPLPVTGTYMVFLEPESAAKGAATASMEVLLDPGQSLAVDGPTSDAAIALPGGSARYTFAGTEGQNLGLGVSNMALNPKVDATVYVYGPNGAQLTAFTCAAAVGGCGGNLNPQSAGTYGIVVRPSAGATGGFGLTLSSDFGGSLVVGGPASQVPLDRPGRNARLTIAGTAGQTLRLIWSAAAISGPSGKALVYLNTPSGSTLGTAWIVNGAAGSYDVPTLPATGNYTLFIDPAAGATLNATLTLVAR